VSAEAREAFPCFGSTCTVVVAGDRPDATAAAAARAARRRLRAWHARFTRFAAGSELLRLNADPSAAVRVSPLMARFAAAVAVAARQTGGLVDATLLRELEDAGYRGDLRAPLPLDLALRLAPPRRRAAPHPAARWRELVVDTAAGIVRRPPGLALDSGGLAKGVFADVLAGELADHDAFALDCAGDLRIGGAAGRPREIVVESPFDGTALHALELGDGGVATSGIGRRSWLDGRGAPAHHLLDPATGRPAFTGVVQVTALAATALEAEIRAKAAVLSGPDGAAGWLPGGGVIVRDDRSVEVLSAGRGRPAPAAAPRSPGPAARPCAA
jgi:thiamine biosynthesis lipoprotein